MDKKYSGLSLEEEVISFSRSEDPHGWIQWKGTDVCIDIHCKCGEISHYDGEFMYHVKCPECKTIYEASGFVKLIEVPEEAFNDEDKQDINEANKP